MDTLPSLILSKIVAYLSFKDRIRCGLVCRSWRLIIVPSYRAQKCLFLHFNHLFPFNSKCAYSGELIRYEDSIQMKNFKFLTSGLSRMYFRNLRKLHIFNIEQFEICIPNLGICVNSFDRLEQLSLTKMRLNEKTTLNLLKLKVLVLKNVSIDNQLDLNCNLQTLICWSDLSKIKLRYPNKLLNLQVRSSNSLELHQHFPNLTLLSYYSQSGLARSDFLANLTRLRQLAVYSPFVESDLKELFRQKRQFKLDQLQILSFGFEENQNSSTKFTYFPINRNYIYLLDRFKLKELSANYDRLNIKMNFPLQLDFCSLDEQFQRIPQDFHQKFTQIHQVNVCWNSNELINDHRPLIGFIKNCGFLPKLVLNNCAFKQSFYDELLNVCSSIGHLEIKENLEWIHNYEFLSRSFIFHLKILLDRLPVELLASVLINQNIKYFEFHRKNFQMHIKHCRNDFHLKINQNFVNSYISLNSLILYLKKSDEVGGLLS